MNRRYFLLGSLAAPLLAANKKHIEAPRPNIVVVMAEEIGAYMLGCYGNSVVRTPNIDQLAQTGVRFPLSFSVSPVTPDPAVFSGAGYVCGRAGATAEASRFIEAQSSGKPFFLAVSWPSPNAVQASANNLALYANAPFDTIGYESAAPNATHPEMLRDVPSNMRKYAAGLSTLDEQIPLLLMSLHKRGLLDNTIVIFSSQGGCLLGRHGLWGGMAASEPPNLYEEAVRTPLVWSCPSFFPPQSVRNEVVNSYDLMPSLYALIGAPPPAYGWSYLNFVYGRPLGKKQAWPNLALGGFQGVEMARNDRYKLIFRNQGKGPNELYDEVADPREMVNHADDPNFSATRDRLAVEITAWRSRASRGAA